MELRPGDKVIVKSFEATVAEGWHAATATVKVRDKDDTFHYVFETQLERISPYQDGKEYRDADNEILIFHRTDRDGESGWSYPGDTYVYAYDYATRPLREIRIGAEIRE